uniref:Uncharacterized protein n=1 Tax=Cryptococcus bacillisporus CA1280 TaxID=1296109 RepID=A0A0D0VUE3_CRYGA|nr:hypothetical protein I312_01188 [Cryptococcus bacillisporus CA1280]
MTDDAISDKKDGSDIALAVKPRRVLMRVENASFGLRKGGASNIWFIGPPSVSQYRIHYRIYTPCISSAFALSSNTTEKT